MADRVTNKDRKQPWQAPRVTRLRAGEAENGALLGQEALVLLS